MPVAKESGGNGNCFLSGKKRSYKLTELRLSGDELWTPSRSNIRGLRSRGPIELAHSRQAI